MTVPKTVDWIHRSQVASLKTVTSVIVGVDAEHHPEQHLKRTGGGREGLLYIL